MDFSGFINWLNGIVWSPALVCLLLGGGLYFTIRTRFVQLRMMHEMVRLIFQPKDDDLGISSFQALSMTLAGRVGTGNIAGVATAIMFGGPGALFWMWVVAILGAASAFIESTLGQVYKEEIYHQFRGGPAYYIEKGLNNKFFAWIFALFTIFSCGLFLPSIQSNSIALSAQMAFGIEPLITAVVITSLLSFIIYGGLKRMATFVSWVVPFMAQAYVVVAIIIIFVHWERFDDVCALIFSSAFDFEAAGGAMIGLAIQWGLKRGLYSNEAGLGSAPMAHAASSEKDPVKQGLYGIFEVFMDTIVICTLTALTLLCGAGDQIVWGQSAGAELISASFSTLFGAQVGSMLVAVGISLFALSTILSWSLYGTRCCEFLLGSKGAKVYQVIFVAVILVGATLKLDLVWNIADTLNGFMAVPNLVALLGLSPVVIKLTKEHFMK